MINKEIIALQDNEQGREKLGRIVAELTTPKPWKHSGVWQTEDIDGVYCKKCKKKILSLALQWIS